ncbi:MAG: AI-2E family transporter [Ruminococcus sp.]|nr:AI-2E family transporter [Ruminococcus sp.]
MRNDKTFIRSLTLIVIGVVLFWGLFNLSSLFSALGALLGVMSPVLLGILLAMILNVPMSAIERNLFRPDKDNNYGKIKGKIKRPVSLLITLVICLGIVSLAIALVLPELIDTVDQMAEKVPQISQHLSDIIKDSKLLSRFLNVEEWTAENIDAKITSLLENSELMFRTVSQTMNIASSIFSGILNFVLALCFAVYMLLQKETLKRQLHWVVTGLFRRSIAERLCRVGNMSKETFSKFISGQTIEACILGLLCTLGMTVFGFPNSLEIGVLVTVTAFIPILGAFVGAAVGAFFIMFTSFKKAVWFLVFIIVLQQLEDNLIYPKVVGKSVGLPSLWVLFAITVGGTVSGILGMFVAVPAFSILYCLFKEFISYLHDRRASKEAASEQEVAEGEQ